MDEWTFRFAVALPVLAVLYRVWVSEPVRAWLRHRAAGRTTRALRDRCPAARPGSGPRPICQYCRADGVQDPAHASCERAMGPAVVAQPAGGWVATTAGPPLSNPGRSRGVVCRAGRHVTWAETVERCSGSPAPVSAAPAPAAIPLGSPDRPTGTPGPQTRGASHGRAAEATVAHPARVAVVSVRGPR